MRMKTRALLLTLLAMLVFVPAALAVEETGSPLAALGINGGFLLAQTFNFLLMGGLLYALLFKPMGNMLDARAEKIKKGLDDAAQAANARRNAEADIEQIKAEARAESQKVISEARTRAEELEKSLRTEAEEEAQKIRENARTAAEQERNQQLDSLRSQVAAIAIAVSNRLIGESLDEGKQQELVNDFFTKVPTDAKSLGGSVEVVSAMPLSDDELNRIKGEIGADSVTNRVDPNILGGLVLRTEDRVVDGSVRTGLDDIAGSLN